MALTQLDTNAALVLVDLQKGILSFGTVPGMDDVITNSAKLAKAFRNAGLPVVLIHVGGMAPGRTETPRPNLQFKEDFTEFLPELDQQPADKVVMKHRWGGFLGTELDEWLKSKGITQVLFGGVATSIGVESTARSAYDLGYNVVMVTDAMTDRDQEMHDHALTKVFPRMAETDTTNNVMKFLSVSASASER